ncbi:helix-turn-helix transcriptional regulator [Undibacterium sp.]|jgi:DNA-binding Xre family transcriptional regulator|uniref:helix-turn-helix domain-containing protein n=1 Tax=Undibacterium sp. TaxID=1914977 RepID=UPI002C38E66D|nr:helix-turn-helix transcriptional regulator [Undibacterium sp.]HTD06643.1 helix-turn-helix transcriptional regulator [Undibacterium sp.]
MVENTENTPIYPKRKLRAYLRVRELMAIRRIHKTSTLLKMLISAGVDISESQFSRVVNNKTDSWKREHLDGLCQVLNCSIGELIGEEEVVNTH